MKEKSKKNKKDSLSAHLYFPKRKVGKRKFARFLFLRLNWGFFTGRLNLKTTLNKQPEI